MWSDLDLPGNGCLFAHTHIQHVTSAHAAAEKKKKTIHCDYSSSFAELASRRSCIGYSSRLWGHRSKQNSMPWQIHHTSHPSKGTFFQTLQWSWLQVNHAWWDCGVPGWYHGTWCVRVWSPITPQHLDSRMVWQVLSVLHEWHMSSDKSSHFGVQPLCCSTRSNHFVGPPALRCTIKMLESVDQVLMLLQSRSSL